MVAHGLFVPVAMDNSGALGLRSVRTTIADLASTCIGSVPDSPNGGWRWSVESLPRSSRLSSIYIVKVLSDCRLIPLFFSKMVCLVLVQAIMCDSVVLVQVVVIPITA